MLTELTELSTHYIPLPDGETQDNVADALTEYHAECKKLSDAEKTNVPGEKVSPKLEACNKILYDAFASTVTSLLTALSSDKAAINNISVALPSVANAIMSTYPDTFSSVRLKAVAGGELFLYMAMMTAYVLHKKYGKEALGKVQDFFKKFGYLCNGFSFIFDTGCKAAAIIAGQELSSTASVNAGVGSLLGMSLALGIFEMYGQTKQPGSRMHTVSGSLYFGFAIGSFFSYVGRLFNYFPINHDRPTPLELAIQWAPPVISVVCVCAGLFYSRRNNVAKPLGAANNGFYTIGTFCETLFTQDGVAAAIIGTKIISIGASHVVLKYACKIPANESQNLLPQQPEEVKAHNTSSVTSSAPAARRTSHPAAPALQNTGAEEIVTDNASLMPGRSPNF